MRKIFENKKNKNGFTLVELLVSISIFSMIVVVIIGSMINAIRTKQFVVQKTYLYDSGRFIMESIIREARVSRIQDNISQYHLFLKHPVLGDIDYEFINQNLIKRNGQSLNPENVRVSGMFRFSNLSCDELPCTTFQPMMTIILNLTDPAGKYKINMQSAASQRELNL